MKEVKEYINECKVINKLITEAKEKFQRSDVTVKEYLANPEKYDAEYKDSSVYVEEDKGSKKTAGHLFYIGPSFTKCYMEGISKMCDDMTKAEMPSIAGLSFSVVLACQDGFLEIDFAKHIQSCHKEDKVPMINPTGKYPAFLSSFTYHGVHVLTDAKNIKKLAKDNGYTFALATGYPTKYGEENCVCSLVCKKYEYTKYGNKSESYAVKLEDINNESFATKAFQAIIKDLNTNEKCKKVLNVIDDLASKGAENDTKKAAEKADLKSGNVPQPFKSKQELMDVIDEIGKTKTALKEWDKKHDDIWKKISALEEKVAQQLDKEGLSISGDYEAWKKREAELQEEYGVTKLNKDEKDLLSNPDYKELNDKLYTRIAKRLEDSLSTAERKKIGKRGGYMYNLMAAVIQKYQGWDPRKK